MKHLSIRIGIVAITTCVFMLCTSFSISGRKTEFPPSVSKQASYYYWYLTSDNAYQGFYPTNTEIADLEEMYDVYVDTDPSGTLLASGYVLYGLPHTIWPSVNLYGHF